MTRTARILVVDDDASVRDALCDYLQSHGFAAEGAEDAAAMDRSLTRTAPDLVVLDLMMPGEDGLSVCRRLSPSGTPILMLSALGATMDRVVGLEIGASDYLAKPFEPRELLARVRALLRRPVVQPEGPEEEVRFAGWRLHPSACALRDPAGRLVGLTAGDHALLAAFVARPGRLLSRDQLLDLARGTDAETYDRAVDVAVSRLRRKLATHDPEPLIETVRGIGYRFVARVERA